MPKKIPAKAIEDVVAVLQQGKELVARGWCQGGTGQWAQAGRKYVCAGVAVNLQFPHVHGFIVTAAMRRIAVHAHNALLATTGDDCEMVSRHNDVHLRSQVECLDWFDRAIRYVKGQ
jgi:hypothetical protein